ncbi:hypothetical protein KFU94_68585 [Chloroflexi bacterium TSY]|nr:hypothetical protein [Chloroflexi bacterium TSY]MBV7332826.1 hypothetical protein [Chloroflexi bacterium TSY]MBV7339792.1 hypothetical protein [Chloroflexi bacterium TSY]
MTPKSLQSRLKIAKNAKFGSALKKRAAREEREGLKAALNKKRVQVDPPEWVASLPVPNANQL